MAITGKTARHTGLPALRVTGPCTVRSGARVVAIVPAGVHYISDQYAEPGENTYSDGTSTISVVREDQGHVLTDSQGRGLVPITLLGSDSYSRSTDVSFFGNSSIVRWPIKPPPLTGTMELKTKTPEATSALHELLQSHAPVLSIHSPSACALKDCDIPPVRVLVLSDGNAKRDSMPTIARREWSLSWREVAGQTAVSPAPVVTWGEYAAHTPQGFTNETYAQICARIAGV